MSISISQLKDHFISLDKAIYATSVVAKYIDTATVKKSTNFYMTTFPFDMIFNNNDVSTSDYEVEIFSMELNIQ